MMTVQLIPSARLTTHGPTVFKTERNQHQTRCGMCGNIIYVEEATFNFVHDFNSGLDDPFCCEVCKEEFNDLAYEE